MSAAADVSRSIIEAIERSNPGAAYVENDEEGRPRAVRLELYPRREELGEALAAVAAEPRDRADCIDRCMATIREAFAAQQRAERELQRVVQIRGATFEDVKAKRDLVRASEALVAHARGRQEAAWGRIRAALEQLVDEAPL